jgi:hypothetical protein
VQSETYSDDGGYSVALAGGGVAGGGATKGTLATQELAAADEPRPSPALDTLIALSDDVCCKNTSDPLLLIISVCASYMCAL